MTIIIKNKETLIYDDFKFRCSIGKKGFTQNKIEGDYKTPTGIFNIGNLYYRYDKFKKPNTKLKCVKIKKNMGWCDNPNDSKNYNKLIRINKKIKHEVLFRKDNKYDYLIPINFNTNKIIPGKGSAIFIHITKKYHATAGCIALSKKDFEIMLKLINKKTKIKIS